MSQLVEFVDVFAMQAAQWREILLARPELYENKEEFNEFDKFVKLHQTPDPKLNLKYVYAVLSAVPTGKTLLLHYFQTPRKLVAITPNRLQFEINGVKKEFPGDGTKNGDELRTIFTFGSNEEFAQFNTLLSLKFSDWYVSTNILDKQATESTENMTDMRKLIRQIDGMNESTTKPITPIVEGSMLKALAMLSKAAAPKNKLSEEFNQFKEDSDDELNSRPGMWRGNSDMAKRMTKKGKPTAHERGMQDNLKNRIKMQNKQGGLTGPTGKLPEGQVDEGYWDQAMANVAKSRKERAGKSFEKNPASHDKDGVYVGDKDLAGRIAKLPRGNYSDEANPSSVYDSNEVEETIVKTGSKYELKSHTGKNLGKYPTKAGAEKREKQVNYFKHVKEDDTQFNDDDWYEVDPKTNKVLRNAGGPSSNRAVMPGQPIRLPNGNILIKGMRAKSLQPIGEGINDWRANQQPAFDKIVKRTDLSPAVKEYLMAINDPKGKIFALACRSYNKGQAAAHEAAIQVAAKYNVTVDELVDAESMYRASQLHGMREGVVQGSTKGFEPGLPIAEPSYDLPGLKKALQQAKAAAEFAADANQMTRAREFVEKAKKYAALIRKMELGEGVGDTIKRGVKSVKRGMQGWGVGNSPEMIAPKGVVSGIKNADDATLNRLIKGGVHQLKGKQPQPHSPQALGQRVLGRELSKRGLANEIVQSKTNESYGVFSRFDESAPIKTFALKENAMAMAKRYNKLNATEGIKYVVRTIAEAMPSPQATAQAKMAPGGGAGGPTSPMSSAPGAPKAPKAPGSPNAVDPNLAKAQQQAMQKGLGAVKSAGVDIDATKGGVALQKSADDMQLSPSDKDQVATMAPGISNVMKDPNLAQQFGQLLKKAAPKPGQQ